MLPDRGDEFERLRVRRADRVEVLRVERGEPDDLQPLGDCDERGVDGSQPEVGIPLDQLSDPRLILRGEIHTCKLTPIHRAKEEHLGCRRHIRLDLPGALDDHRDRHEPGLGHVTVIDIPDKWTPTASCQPDP